MRLIDADAFFRDFPELDIEPYINAPTVGICFEGDQEKTEICGCCDLRHKNWEQGFSAGFEEGKKDNERPQGKWIDPNNVGANNWCSVCGEFILHYNGICNFCPNCGADMRGEEE